MADFINTTTSKSAVRELRYPIATLAAFDAIISGVVATNPWNCVPYQFRGEAQPGVGVSKQSYTGKVLYQDDMGKVIGTITVKAPTQAGFTSSVLAIEENTGLEGMIGGIAARDASKDTYSCTLRCHSASGDLYYVTFTRDKVRVTSYEQDSVLADLESWADEISALS
ncbi:MAG: hypothetical protein FWF19_01150 [Euryarchaeota archaeon]|nr:hypothetical protein [Euryarchaeota archaeon]